MALHNVTGTAMYAKLFERNRDMHEAYHGSYDGAYTIGVILDKEELDKVTKSGCRAKPRITDEGIMINFKRKHKDLFPETSGAPKVADADNKPWDTNVNIGNGSKVEVWFDVYDTKMGKGTRLVGVKVLDLVEFEGTAGESDGLPF